MNSGSDSATRVRRADRPPPAGCTGDIERTAGRAGRRARISAGRDQRPPLASSDRPLIRTVDVGCDERSGDPATPRTRQRSRIARQVTSALNLRPGDRRASPIRAVAHEQSSGHGAHEHYTECTEREMEPIARNRDRRRGADSPIPVPRREDDGTNGATREPNCAATTPPRRNASRRSAIHTRRPTSASNVAGHGPR